MDQNQIFRIRFENRQPEDIDADWKHPFGKWFAAYLNGSSSPLDWNLFNLDSVKPFSQKVYRSLWSIPKGETRTYKEIATHIGSLKACRAVGSANRCNELPLIIPCHRVVASGGLGGFSGGLPLKIKLLQFEGVHVSQ